MSIDKIATGVGAAGNVLGMIQGIGAGKRQQKRSKELMGIQFENQSKLNAQQKEDSKEMWDYTNYENQVSHMEKAGLSPGLLYGGGGGGGATTSGTSAGSASAGGGGAAEQIVSGRDMTGLGMMAAQMNLIDAQTDKVKAEAENLRGTDRENRVADTGLKTADTNLRNLQAENQKVLNSITEESSDAQIGTIIANYNKAEGEAGTAVARGKMANETVEAELTKLRQEGVNAALQAEAIKAGVRLTEEQTRRISEELAQGWEELYQKGRANDNQKGMVNIAGFKAKLDEILGKANLDLRAKEMMIKGAGTFLQGIKKGGVEQNGDRQTTINNY